MNALSALAAFYKDGGFFMHLILATGMVSLAIVVERMIVIAQASSLNSTKLTDDLLRALQRGDLMGARNLSRTSNAPAAQVAQAMLHAAGDESRLQTVADDAATLALTPLTRRIPQLNLLANVATLLGLLGTVFGLITAFSAVGAADASQRSAFLAAGISTALNTTAFGLLVAVPVMLAQGWLVGLVDRVSEQVDETIIRLSQTLAKPPATSGQGHVVAMPAGRAAAAPAAPRGAMPQAGGAQ
jgi:biopolymer transport protein ExbB/TolQ